jgi:hypothetical protein
VKPFKLETSSLNFNLIIWLIGPHCPTSELKPNKTVCHEEFVCYKGVSQFLQVAFASQFLQVILQVAFTSCFYKLLLQVAFTTCFYKLLLQVVFTSQFLQVLFKKSFLKVVLYKKIVAVISFEYFF